MVAIALVVGEARVRRDEMVIEHDDPRPRWRRPGQTVERRSRRGAVVDMALWAISTGALIGPGWIPIGVAVGTVSVISRRDRVAELVAVGSLTAVAVAVVAIERRDAPLPDGAWPSTFESLHELGVFAAVALLVAVVRADDARADRRERADTGADPVRSSPVGS